SYAPFGALEEITTDTFSLESQHLRFPGQWFQSETGLHQNWHRDYDPRTGRYLQADPLGLVDGPSVYGYVRQRPFSAVDPNGLELIAEYAEVDVFLGPGLSYQLGSVEYKDPCTGEDKVMWFHNMTPGGGVDIGPSIGKTVFAGEICEFLGASAKVEIDIFSVLSVELGFPTGKNTFGSVEIGASLLLFSGHGGISIIRPISGAPNCNCSCETNSTGG
ncbi:MAG: RHS repeat-associated core domain-containing protein, partial [Pseudomonadota bacterium]